MLNFLYTPLIHLSLTFPACIVITLNTLKSDTINTHCNMKIAGNDEKEGGGGEQLLIHQVQNRRVYRRENVLSLFYLLIKPPTIEDH